MTAPLLFLVRLMADCLTLAYLFARSPERQIRIELEMIKLAMIETVLSNPVKLENREH